VSAEPLPPVPARADFAVDDAELRAAASVKWTYQPADVVPAWVAEMDVRPCPAVQDAVRDAVERGVFGYPMFDTASGLPEATAAFQRDRFGWDVDPAHVLACGDVMAGVRLVLEVLCEPAPVVVPTPTYPPFLDVVPLAGREVVQVPCATDGGGRPVLELDAVDAAFAAGARTVLLAQPHNPLGRAFTAGELGALRDVVTRYPGGRVVSDEIHSPLALPGATHTPYLSVEGTADHGVAVVAASKAWNIPGLKCAQVVSGSNADRAALRGVAHVANHGLSPLGSVATIAAYTHGRGWLDDLVAALDDRRALFGDLLAAHLPDAGWRPMEATYLAWVDARAYGLENPSATALAKGRVLVNPGKDFGTGYDGFVRVNLATSRDRLTEVVERLAKAWTA
jgi:cystathionine beta-lyase